MKAYILNHCLSSGMIFEVEAERYSDDTICIGKSVSTQYFHCEGRGWCSTPEAALAKAEEMRARKIVSLKKQIKKLEAVRFLVKSQTETPNEFSNV